MDRRLHVSARIQTTWIDNENLIVRYEDLIRDEQAEFKKIISYCNIDMTDDALSAAVNRHSFENRAGRKRGEEGCEFPSPKGSEQDWQNYFDEKLIREFKALWECSGTNRI
ncbi:MAG: sulfotransferase domain-containing protein [Desulfobacterales bacterium]